MTRIREGNVESVLYFTDQAALSAFASENRDLGLFDETLSEEELAGISGPSRRAVLYELHESTVIAKIFARLNELGIDTDTFYSMDTPIFELLEDHSEDKSIPIFVISEILDKILEISAKGIQIKRFKGLGEMNAKQLFGDHHGS